MNKYEITAGLNYLKESTLNEFNPYNEKGERWDDDPEPDKYDARNAKLVTKDGQEVKLPYETVDFRGDPMTVIGFTPPHKSSSTGRIHTDDGMSYFPSVVGLKIVGVIFSDGSVRESTEDDDLRDEESGKNHDPETGKRTKPHPFDPGEEELHEGKMKDIISDAHDMSKEEFDAKYKGEWDYDEIMREYPLDEAGKPSRPRKGRLVTKDGQEVRLPYETVDFRGDKIVITGYQAPHKRGSSGRIYTDDGDQWSYFPGVADLKIIDYGPLEEADGSGSYGGQSPLTYQHDDDELNKITRLSGLGEARKKRPDAYDDDWDNEDEDEKVEDPDKDKVPHILMQIKKAIDVDGDHDIKFEDGGKHKFSITDLNMFFKKYMSMKPAVREQMQEVAIMGKEEFDTILSIINPKKK
jgi:hypothetical protein